MTDDAAYGRLTNPERYAPLHAAATELVADLLASYLASVDTDSATPAGDIDLALDRPVRVCPDTGGGGCVRIELTSFPGVSISLGRWQTFHFPVCGCDACDEQISDLVDEMTSVVDAFTNGRFTEYIVDGRLGLSWSGPGGSSAGWSALDDDHPLRHHPAETIDWPSWERRPG